MAQDKKSFILYSDQRDIFNQLTDEQAGKLIKHIYSYVNDENPETEDIIINLAFTSIKQQLKRDLKKWEVQYNQRVKAGKKSAEVRKRNSTSVNERSISSTVNVNGNVTVTDNVNDNVKNIPLLEDFLNYGKSVCEELGKNPDLYIYGMTTKFESWKDADWVNGKGNKIKNWKITLRNTIPYITERKIRTQTNNDSW